VKRFAYILSLDRSFIEAANSSSIRFTLLSDVINIDLAKQTNNLIPIELDVTKLNSRLRALIEERKHRLLDIPDYKGRFTEDEIFVEKNLFGEILKLCNTGFDNQIIFLANLLERQQSEVLRDRPAYIFLADNHKELRDYLQSNESLG
jgi:hypothetical protein